MKKVYLLDTNIVSEFSKEDPNLNVVAFYEARKDLCAISAITWQELVYGCVKMPEGKRKNYVLSCLELIKQNFEIISYDDYSANICGTLLAKLKMKGKSLPYSDTQIASNAIANGMILVTHNVKDFCDIKERSFLRVEDWFEEA